MTETVTVKGAPDGGAEHGRVHGDRRGLYDGFEGYITPVRDDYERVLTGGMVVPDANVLLNLYRYTDEARADLLSVLERVGENLWVPNQVLEEFWRNRESVLRDPGDTEKTVRELNSQQTRTLSDVRAWANRVFLPLEKLTALLKSVEEGFDSVISEVEDFAASSTVDFARDTHKDTILKALEPILRSRVGPPLEGRAYREAVIEGLRRVAAKEPPGYKDKKKDDDGAAGDYLVWEQVLIEAGMRATDVLFVTGDVKEDWWREESGERRGPRIELVNEMRRRSNSRLFMLRPTQLMEYAKNILSVDVRDESVRDVDLVDNLVSESGELLPDGGWDVISLQELLRRLDFQASVQANVIRRAAEQSGYVTRDQVYKLGNYPDERSLRGFTRPINRIAQFLRDHGLLPRDAVDVLWAVYNDDSPNIGWAAGFQIHESVLHLFAKLGADFKAKPVLDPDVTGPEVD